MLRPARSTANPMVNEVLALLLCCLVLSLGNFSVASATGEKHSGSTFWPTAELVLGCLAAGVIVVIVLIRALRRGTRTSTQERHPPTPAQFRESFFSPHTTQSILENLRSLSSVRFAMALEQVANCPLYDEEVVRELTKLVGGLHPYTRAKWLTVAERCRACRFLHLALERNRAAELGERFDNGVDFQAIFYASPASCCVIRTQEEESFFLRLAGAFKEVLSHLRS